MANLKAILEAIPSPGAKGATLVIGGDGRFYNKEVMQIIAKMALANGVHGLFKKTFLTLGRCPN